MVGMELSGVFVLTDFHKFRKGYGMNDRERNHSQIGKNMDARSSHRAVQAVPFSLFLSSSLPIFIFFLFSLGVVPLKLSGSAFLWVVRIDILMRGWDLPEPFGVFTFFL